MDLDAGRLIRLRAAVGRFGEMDAAGWWNTQGVLGPRGAAVYKRGFPRTQFLARLHVVASVAGERSAALYPAPGVATLWKLPPALERTVTYREREWASSDKGGDWSEFETAIASPPPENLVKWLDDLGLIEPGTSSEIESLALVPGGAGIAVPGPVGQHAVELLAAAHGRSKSRQLVVPFISDGLDANVD